MLQRDSFDTSQGVEEGLLVPEWPEDVHSDRRSQNLKWSFHLGSWKGKSMSNSLVGYRSSECWSNLRTGLRRYTFNRAFAILILFLLGGTLFLFSVTQLGSEKSRPSSRGAQTRQWHAVKDNSGIWRSNGPTLSWRSTKENTDGWILSKETLPEDWVLEAKFRSTSGAVWPEVIFSVEENLRQGLLLSLNGDLSLSRIEQGRRTSEVAKLVDTHGATLEGLGMRERAVAERLKLRNVLEKTTGTRSIKLLKTGSTYAFWVDGLLITTIFRPGHRKEASKEPPDLLTKNHYFGFVFTSKGAGTVTDITVRQVHLAERRGGGPVLEPGPAGAWDDGVIWSKCVIREGGKYHLYFGGRDKKSPKDGGSVGLATSLDLVRWTRSPGNPILDENKPQGPWESHTLLTGDVTPAPDGRFALLYNGHDGKVWRGVGLAFADTLQGPFIPFDKNPVLTPGQPGQFDSGHIHEHALLRQDDGTYVLVYTGYTSTTDDANAKLIINQGGDLKKRLGDRGGLATSKDLIHWKKHAANPVFELGPAGAWDDGHVRPGTIAKLGEWYYMFYEGAHFDGKNWADEIGAARSKDLIHWQKFPYNPIIPAGIVGDFDHLVTIWPAAIVVEGKLYVFFTCIVGDPARLVIWKAMISPESLKLWDANP